MLVDVGVSRTRLLVEAIHDVIPGAKVLLTDAKTVLLSQAVRDGVRVVRVHQMFLDGDDEVRRAVAVYLATGSKKAGVVVDTFTRARTHLLSYAARPLREGAWLGAHHDLSAHFAAMNTRYFDGVIVAEIGWGQSGVPTRARRRSITFGSFDHRAKRITMHPVLDQAHVPPLVVARVVHHEMLHAKHGEAHDKNGRRVVHSRAFRAEEATFDGAAEADAWLDANLEAMLRFRPQRTS